jgi:hypothetical protein
MICNICNGLRGRLCSNLIDGSYQMLEPLEGINFQILTKQARNFGREGRHGRESRRLTQNLQNIEEKERGKGGSRSLQADNGTIVSSALRDLVPLE